MTTDGTRSGFDIDRECIEGATPGEWRRVGQDVRLYYYDYDHRMAYASTEQNAEFIARSRTRWPAALARIAELEDDILTAEHVLIALRAVLSEEGVKEHLSAYVMGIELIDRLAAYDVVGEKP